MPLGYCPIYLFAVYLNKLSKLGLTGHIALYILYKKVAYLYQRSVQAPGKTVISGDGVMIMTKRTGKVSALLMAAAMLLALLAGCGQSAQPVPTGSLAPATPTPAPVPTPTPKPAVTIGSMFPGEEPAGLKDVFKQLNKKLEQDISVKLELSWTSTETYDADMEAALASGKQIDFLWCSPGKLAGYAGKSLIVPLDDYMAQYGQALTQNIGAPLFDLMKVDGKLMGIPSAGNVPLCGAGHVLTAREDLRLKYSLPKLDSIDNIELYLKTVHGSEPGVAPLCGNAAEVIMPAFGPEELLGGTAGAVAFTINSGNTVTCEPLQNAASFKGAAAKVREWFIAGYIPAGMIEVKDSLAQLASGKAASAVGGVALAALGTQGAAASAVPGAQLADVPVFGAQKYIMSDGGSALCLTAASKKPAEVVQFWNWIVASQENYDLLNYGIKDQNYKLDGERIAYLNDSYKSFPAWMFTNMNFERYPAGASDDYIDTLKHWNDGAVVSPLLGFVFDPTPVKDIVAKVQLVYDAYAPAINAGSADTAALIAEFGAKMKAAGQDKIVTEAQKQIDAFLSAVK